MPDPTTPLIGLNIPVTGSDVGTWGLSLNENFDAIDGANGGIEQITITGGTTTLLPTQLPFATIQFVGSLTSNAIIVVPAWSGYLTILNSTTGAFSLTVVLSGQPKAVVVPQGQHINMFFSPVGPVSANFTTGTIMLFAQAAAPVGWTQVTTVNDAALRIVNGGSGGTVTGTIGLSAFIAAGDNPIALSLGQIPAHTHGYIDPQHFHAYSSPIGGFHFVGGTSAFGVTGGTPNTTNPSGIGITIQNAGGGGTHAHGLPDLKYFDCLIASKA
jgi:hypothetical protein